MKIPVVIRENYIMYLEYVENEHIFHCDVFKWTKNVRNNFIKDFETLCSLSNTNLYYFSNKNDAKLQKFGKFLNFKKVKDFADMFGNEYTLFLRRN